eukprot:scaffold94259_cov51-Phaeocystis_antarctica.AAC.2
MGQLIVITTRVSPPTDTGGRSSAHLTRSESCPGALGLRPTHQLGTREARAEGRDATATAARLPGA